MTYAILSADTITAHGPASVLWPDTSFASNGPNASFLADVGAVTIRSDAAYDPATELLQPCEPYVIDGEVFNFIAAPIIPPAPTPDWATFKSTALNSSSLNSILAAAYGVVPVAAGALPPALLAAEQGRTSDFSASWSAICAAVPVDLQVITGFVGIATDCNLPVDFIAALTPTAT